TSAADATRTATSPTVRGRQPTASRRAVSISPTGRKVNRDSRGNIQQAAPTGRTISTRQNTSTRGAAALPAAAAALQYLDQETRTWTTDDFVAAMETIRDSGLTAVPGILYCGGQGGDQGTRALVNNLYSGTYTNPEHTEYTVNSPENVK